jgi:hypothetical protein
MMWVMVTMAVAASAAVLLAPGCETANDEDDAGVDGHETWVPDEGTDLGTYRWNLVRIEDDSGPVGSLDPESPGADIDAIGWRAHGSVDEHHPFMYRSTSRPASCGGNQFTNGSEVEGAPAVSPDAAFTGFASLCGADDYLEVDMGSQALSNEDTIVVYEVGAVTSQPGEPVSFRVLAANYRDDEVELGTCTGGTCTLTVSGL